MRKDSLEKRLNNSWSKGKAGKLANAVNTAAHDASAFAAKSAFLGISFVAAGRAVSGLAANGLENIVGNNAINANSAELWGLAGIGALAAGPFLGRPIKGFYEKMKADFKGHLNRTKDYNWPLVTAGIAGAVSLPIALRYANADSIPYESLRAFAQYAQQGLDRTSLAVSAGAIASGYGARKLIGHAFKNLKPFKKLKAKAATLAALGAFIGVTMSNPAMDAIKKTSAYQDLIQNPDHVAVYFSSPSARDALAEYEKLADMGVDVSLLRDFSNEGIFRVVSEPGSRRSIDSSLAELKEQELVKEQSWIKVLDEYNNHPVTPEQLREFGRASELPDYVSYIQPTVSRMVERSTGYGFPINEIEATRMATAIYIGSEAFEVPAHILVAISEKESNHAFSVVGDTHLTDRYGRPNDARTSFQFLRRTMESWHREFLNDKEAMQTAREYGIEIWNTRPSYEDWHKYPEVVAMIAAYKFRKDIDYFMRRTNNDMGTAMRYAIGAWNGGRGNPIESYAASVIEIGDDIKSLYSPKE